MNTAQQLFLAKVLETVGWIGILTGSGLIIITLAVTGPLDDFYFAIFQLDQTGGIIWPAIVLGAALLCLKSFLRPSQQDTYTYILTLFEYRATKKPPVFPLERRDIKFS